MSKFISEKPTLIEKCVVFCIVTMFGIIGAVVLFLSSLVEIVF